MNGQCVTVQDGYYYVSAICIALGVLTFVVYIIPTAKRLEGEPRSPASYFDELLTHCCSVACNQMAGGLSTVTYVAHQLSYNSSGYLESSDAPVLRMFFFFFRKFESCDYFRVGPSWEYEGVLEKP